MPFADFLDGELWARVGMALLCGGIVGLERQLRGKPAGMRTSTDVFLPPASSSATFTLGSSLKRFASTQPALPAPTMT